MLQLPLGEPTHEQVAEEHGAACSGGTSLGDRPSVVTWIGRAWLVVSVLCLIGGARILLMSIGDADMELGLPAGVMSATAALIAYCSVAFLRLRRWARSALEAASWLALCYVVVCGGFGVYRFAATGHKAMAGMILCLSLAVVWGVPLALGLVLLRRPALREVFGSRQ